MQKRLNIFLAILTLLFFVQEQGQAQYKKKDLIGVWKISFEKITESLSEAQRKTYNNMSDEQKKAFANQIEQMLDKMRIEFQPKGKALVNIFGSQGKKATWKMKKNKLTMNTEGKLREMTILELTAKKFKFKSTNNAGTVMKVTMVRVK